MNRIDIEGPYPRRRIAPPYRVIYVGAVILLSIVAGLAWFAR